MIRDLSKRLNKKMELEMTGEDTELDRTVVDQLGDPLQHLLRNSADHGLESAELRKERGKSEVGIIFLKAFQEGNNVIIEVGDDGNGIDTESVKEKANRTRTGDTGSSRTTQPERNHRLPVYAKFLYGKTDFRYFRTRCRIRRCKIQYRSIRRRCRSSFQTG